VTGPSNGSQSGPDDNDGAYGNVGIQCADNILKPEPLHYAVMDT